MLNGKSLVSEWNKAHPEWAYETSVGDLDTHRFWRNLQPNQQNHRNRSSAPKAPRGG
jgi:hypothetical protein